MRPLNWSLRQQILTPVMLAGILVVFWLFERVTARRMATMDVIEDQTILALARDLNEPPISRDQLADRFAWLKAAYPGWEFVALDGSNVVAGTVDLMERDLMVLEALPARSPDRPGRDHKMEFESIFYGPRAWFWVTKLWGDGKLSGVQIALLYSTSYAESLDATMDYQDELAAALIAVALVLLAIWYGRRLSRRITRIQEQVRQIADGRTSEPVDERGSDEISELARSVNHMAADLGAMKTRVEQAERSKVHAQISRGISHELRNGIHAARLALEMFREDEDDHAPSPLIATSYNQLCVTESMVRRLLTVGQPIDRKVTARPLQALLSDAAELVTPIFRHAEIEFTHEIAAELGTVRCDDAESMQSAVVNLCLNALEAAGRHGQVRLSAAPRGDEVEIEVSDSGPGPAPQVADTLFEPFVTTKPEGVGLGLVLVRKAVTDAGGTVGWSREQERRTIFRICLPARGPVERSEPAPTEVPRPAAAKV